ncbi:mucin-19-like [Echeneis naucrates]|uniref:mucin-19-like n=1 Tax=Echeneis naucrates TaxID=173247 RepID=UPI00111370C6|nr:mucin-19-like [Echeneis naucrates]XP_029386444.1 mucin-19-like [Echeneis naucrates]
MMMSGCPSEEGFTSAVGVNEDRTVGATGLKDSVSGGTTSSLFTRKISSSVRSPAEILGASATSSSKAGASGLSGPSLTSWPLLFDDTPLSSSNTDSSLFSGAPFLSASSWFASTSAGGVFVGFNSSAAPSTECSPTPTSAASGADSSLDTSTASEGTTRAGGPSSSVVSVAIVEISSSPGISPSLTTTSAGWSPASSVLAVDVASASTAAASVVSPSWERVFPRDLSSSSVAAVGPRRSSRSAVPKPEASISTGGSGRVMSSGSSGEGCSAGGSSAGGFSTAGVCTVSSSSRPSSSMPGITKLTTQCS